MSKLKKKNIQSTRNTLINIAIWLFLSLIISYFGEKISQPSAKNFYKFLQERPGLFLLDYTIILCFTSFAFLFVKTRAVLFIEYVIIIAAYISHRSLLTFRGTPFSWSDIYSLDEGIAMAGTYGLMKYLLPGAIGIVLVIGLVIFLVKTEPNYSKLRLIRLSGFPIIIVGLLLPKVADFTAEKLGTPATVYDWDVGTTYAHNGFMYSFVNSKTSFKVDIPENYTASSVSDIMNNLSINNDNYTKNDESPNVIFVQLESFLDPKRIKEIDVINDPIPTIRNLLNNYTSGLVQVPTFGAQTVRSEFEALTGMSTDYLPAYSIPNNNVLQKGPVESLAQIFKNDGYTSSFVHNFTGGFYDRDLVVRNFGFDYYISKEYMDMPENYGIANYPEDVLNLETMKELLNKSSTIPQFIYNVTVESHGFYSTDYEYDSLDFFGSNLTDTEKCQIQDFFDRLKGVDKYISELISLVNNLDRHTIIVMFSDHLPSMEVINRSDSSIVGNDRYLTEAIVYDNFNANHKKENINLELYTLGSYVIDRYNLATGILPNLHNTYMNDENYESIFELIQYDMLYGKKYYNSGVNLYSKANTVLGLKEITLDSYYIEGDTVVIKGQNFTYLSKAAINNKIIPSTYVVDEKTMNVGLEHMSSGTLTINQMSVVGSNVKSLSSSNGLKFKKKKFFFI